MFIAAPPIRSPEIGLLISGFFVVIASQAMVRTLYAKWRPHHWRTESSQVFWKTIGVQAFILLIAGVSAAISIQELERKWYPEPSIPMENGWPQNPSTN